MKKFVLPFLLLILFAASNLYAAGSCVVGPRVKGTLKGESVNVVSVTVTCTADASNGSYPDTTITGVGGFLSNVYVNPGSPTPTTGMDMTLELGTTGIDLLGGAGTNIVTAADALITPLNTADKQYLPGFTGDLTLKQSNNSVNSAVITYILIISP